MKILILGVDGLGLESLKYLGLKNLSALINAGISANPLADNMVSRGWAEIYTGVDAYTSGAFFQIPVKRDREIRKSQNTGVDTTSAHCGIENLLWSRLRNKGLEVGLFTLPTVTSPQLSCEFSFSATGAGQFNNSLGSASIHPDSLSSKANYTIPNLGLRIGRGAFLPGDIYSLERWLQDHLSQYFHTLRCVLNKKHVNTLILGTRFVTLYYKFRHILASSALGSSDQIAKNVLLEISHDFDYELCRIVREYNADHIFVVSDHGIGELRYHVNINELLRMLGEINYMSPISSISKSVARYVRDRFKNVRRDYYPSFDLASSRAFSCGYTDVIYINDSRFTGPVMSLEQRYNAAVELAEKLTSLTSSEGLHQFVAFEPMKNSGYTSPKNEDLTPIPLPDIRCHLAEGCVNLERTHGVPVAKNNPYGSMEMFSRGFAAEHSGCKTGDTIAAYIGSHKSNFAPKRLIDLYGEILSIAN